MPPDFYEALSKTLPPIYDLAILADPFLDPEIAPTDAYGLTLIPFSLGF
jgi:hypothetical protein|tara:strand:+ start:296 stop:442 length:147 start_codon:yes stop_codon:yes gene_type:complete